MLFKIRICAPDSSLVVLHSVESVDSRAEPRPQNFYQPLNPFTATYDPSYLMLFFWVSKGFQFFGISMVDACADSRKIHGLSHCGHMSKKGTSIRDPRYIYIGSVREFTRLCGSSAQQSPECRCSSACLIANCECTDLKCMYITARTRCVSHSAI